MKQRQGANSSRQKYEPLQEFENDNEPNAFALFWQPDTLFGLDHYAVGWRSKETIRLPKGNLICLYSSFTLHP
jgi:hypothetical protein